MSPEEATIGALCALIIGMWLWVLVDVRRHRGKDQ